MSEIIKTDEWHWVFNNVKWHDEHLVQLIAGTADYHGDGVTVTLVKSIRDTVYYHIYVLCDTNYVFVTL